MLLANRFRNLRGIDFRSFLRGADLSVVDTKAIGLLKTYESALNLQDVATLAGATSLVQQFKDSHRLANLTTGFKDIRVVDDFKELESSYDLADYYEVESGSFPMKATLVGEYGIVPCVNRDTGKKAIGVLYPTFKISAFYFEEIFLITENVSRQIANIESFGFLEVEEKDTEKKVMQILETVENRGINDIHFKPGKNGYEVTGRIAARLFKFNEGGEIRYSVMQDIIRVLLDKAKQDYYTKSKEKRGYIGAKLFNRKIMKEIDRPFRLHIVMVSDGRGGQLESVSIRRHKNHDEIRSLGFDGLNYHPKVRDTLQFVLKNKLKGLLIVAGSTNQGKSTLLATIVDYAAMTLKNGGKRIMSIESPIEIHNPSIMQIDLKDTENADESIRMDTASAMKAMQSQDLDIGVIQEVRSREEINDALWLAINGLFTMTTIHTDSNDETMTKLLTVKDSSTTEDNIYSSTRGLFSQNLIDKKCSECGGTGKKIDDCPICEGNDDNCQECNGTGKRHIKCPTCQGVGVDGGVPICEMVVFLKKPTGKIDLKNKQLLREMDAKGEIAYLSKYENAKWLFDKGLIAEETLKEIALQNDEVFEQ